MSIARPIPFPTAFRSSNTVLWIGSRRKIGRVANELGDILDVPVERIHPVQIGDISPDLLREHQPASAFSMLTWIGGDALEAARAMSAAGYQGPYRVFGPPLPVPALVEQEVRAIAPGLDFAIVPSRSRARR